MQDSEILVEHSRPSPLKLALFGLVVVPAAFALALLEIQLLGAVGLNADELRYAALLSILNLVALELAFFRFGRSERWWFAAGASIDVAIAVFVLWLPASDYSVSLPSSGSGPPMVALRKGGLFPLPAPPPPISVSPAAPSSPPLDLPPDLPQPGPKTGKAPDYQQERADLPLPSPRPSATLVPTIEFPSPSKQASAFPPEPSFPQAAPSIELSPEPPTLTPTVSEPSSPKGAPVAPTHEGGKAKATGAAPSAADAAEPDIKMGPAAGDKARPGGKKAKAGKAGKSRPAATSSDGDEVAPAAGGSSPAVEVNAPAAVDTVPSVPPIVADGAAHWNTWFVQGAGPASNILIAGQTYLYSLDLSAFNYAALRKIAQSSEVRADREIGTLLKSSLSEVELDIKPVIPEGSGLKLVDDTTKYLMKVDLDRIRAPNLAAARQYAADQTIPISKLSEQVSAGSIRIPVIADAQGCATIAFSIFKGMRPLDHLVQRVAIGEDSSSAPVCDESDPEATRALSGGLDSLREVALGMEGSGPSLLAAGALHIFESAASSMVVFVDGRPGQSQSAYGWQTESSVVDYLRTDNFQGLILKARKDSANNISGSYVRAAQELSKVLFVAKPGTLSEARKAKAAFKSLVRESQAPPVIVVRVASSRADGQNRSIYVPLGILGAKGPDAELDKPIVVVQPMAIERYEPSSKCIGDWTFAVPNKLQDVPEETMPDNFFPAKISGTRILDIAHLKPYFASSPVDTVGALPQEPGLVGLLVLAHQDEGFLWFDESTDPIMQQDISRDFPSGSVGVFAACSAASSKGRNTAILQKLNQQGMGTIIASPFAIDAAYGVTFASSFAEIVEETAGKAGKPTILELFNQAISRTGQKFKDRNNGDYGELGLEYVLLGNPAMTLCNSERARGPQ